MFSIEYEDFLNNPLLFGLNTVNQIILYLHVFDFQGSFGRQTDLIFLLCHFLRD
jgi:hypothetical protein